MRLLPGRHDHGGGGAAAGQARSPPTPTSTTPSPTSAAAAPSSRCARPSTPPPARDEGGNHELRPKKRSEQRSEHRSPLLRRRQCCRRCRLLARHESAVRLPAHAQGTPELNAWVVVRPDDTVVVRFARSEMGQGIAHRPVPAGRRGARMRLVEGHVGVRRPAPEHHPQARLWRLQLHRQPRDPRIARLCAARRRSGARRC